MRLLATLFTLLFLNCNIQAQVSDNYANIIATDQFPYERTIQQANNDGDKILLGEAYIARGEYYERQNKRREAIREYKKAYGLDNSFFLYANNRINQIKNRMNSQRDSVQGVINQETANRAENFQLFMSSVDAVGQIQQAVSQKTASSRSSNQTTYSSNSTRTSNSSYSNSYSTSNNNSSYSTTNQKTEKAKRKCPICDGGGKCYTTHGVVSEIYKQYCRGDGKCHACGGEGRLSSGFGNGYIQCTYCDGTLNKYLGNGVCGKCHGTGKCHRCNGKGYL